MEHLKCADGSTIHFIALGGGPAVIFLHGWTSSAREWLAHAADLATDYRVLCWDARGHGRHNTPLASAQVKDMASDLHRLIEHQHLRDVVLVGHSMGALTAWEYIRHYGCGALKGLCILDQSPCLLTRQDWNLGIYGDFNAQRNAAFIEDLHDDFAETVLRLSANGHNLKIRENYISNTLEIQKTRTYLSRQSSAQLIESWESLCRQDYRSVLPEINIPALLVYGAKSQFYGNETARYVARSIPDSTLLIYENADHSPHLEAARFLEDLKAFLNKIHNTNADRV